MYANIQRCFGYLQSTGERDKLRESLLKLLVSSDPSVELRKPEKSSKSYAWASDCFLMVYKNNVKQSFVFCNMCSNLITYNSVHGTGSLLRHVCFRRSFNINSPVLKAFRNVSSTPTQSEKLSSVTLTPGTSQFAASKGTDLTKFKKEIEERIEMKDPSIALQTPANIKSEIWSNGNFRTIYKDGVKLDFVMCLLCKSLITYRSKTGTASLLRHSCMRGMHTTQRNRSQPATIIKMEKVTMVNAKAEEPHVIEVDNEIETEGTEPDEHAEPKFIEVEEMPINIGGQRADQDAEYYYEFPDEYKDEAAKLLHCFTYQDMHSICLAGRKGFHDFGQYLINLGAEYGKVSIASVLENRDSIHLGNNFVNILQNMLKNKFDEHKIALSCDIWTDPHRKTNFLTVYGHYIDESYKMRKVNFIPKS